MQYKVIHNKRIDRVLWDACVCRSVAPDIYALSWYLDIESPLWCGIVFGDYDMVFPLPIESKFVVFKAIRTNFLTKDFNVYGLVGYDERWLGQVILKEIRKFMFVNLFVNKSIPLPSTGKLVLRKKQYIDFDTHTSYPQKTLRKSIRDAEAYEYVVIHDIDIHQAVSFLKAELCLKQELKESFFLDNLDMLIHKSIQEGYGYVSGLYKNSDLCAVDFYAKIGTRLYLIQNAGNKLSKTGGMPYLLYQIIERFRGVINHVDFMGSNSPNIISFNRNFCNQESEYYCISKP